jgi:hypothetical protein
MSNDADEQVGHDEPVSGEREIDGELFADPSLELRSFDVRRNVATFGGMTPEAYAESVFLNLRGAHRRSSDVYRAPLDGLLELFADAAPPTRPVHFVFHNAFCCSTLLSRCLEHLSFGFSLREPNALKELVGVKRNGWPGPDRGALLDCVIALLARTFDPATTAFVKANDHCNAVIEDVLERRADSGALLLYGDLDTFVCKALKNEERTKQVVRAAQDVIDNRRGPEVLRRIEHQNLPPPHAAAFCWVAHAIRFREVLQNAPHARVASLEYHELLRDPAGVLRGYLALCGFNPSEDEIARATSKDAIGYYSKSPRLEYNAETHERELAELQAKLQSELADAHRWVQNNNLTDYYGSPGRPLVLLPAQA